MGDFNEIFHPSDKVGGTPLTRAKTRRFNEFLDYTTSIDANVQRRSYTCKKILKGQLILQKIG